MDIRKPKPIHGWRELFKEVGIIVIGVLIALGAGQTVEWLNWQARVRSAEDAIRRDLALTADIASERVAIRRCLDDRLDALKILARGTGPGLADPLPADASGFSMGAPYRAPARAWNTQVWDGMKADGTATHLDPERARALSLLYLTVSTMREANRDEKLESTDLQVLEEKGMTLTPDKRVELIQHIARLRRFNGELASVSRQILRRISDVGDLPPLPDTERRLASPYSRAMSCRYAEEDLKTRVLDGWFTLHR